MSNNWKDPAVWQRAVLQARSQDATVLQRLWQRWRRSQDARELAQLHQRWQQSCAWVEQRRQQARVLEYPDLPVSNRRQELVELLSHNPVLIVAGETGSGKTTQLPKLCLEAGRGLRGLIGHTQPRRLAARQVALRLAEELRSSLGDQVGCCMRFSDQTSEQNVIKVMTDGILLAELRQDRWLSAYDTLIIDEAHERSLNIDFILGTLKLLRKRRPDLQVVITSATLQVEKFSEFFDGAPIIEVEGRSWPVETFYRPVYEDALEEDAAPDAEVLHQAVRQALHFCWEQERIRRWPTGDALVFLSTERELRELHSSLRSFEPEMEILPLYARLSVHEQQKVFAAHQRRRIILATNVAETSVTVPGIYFVIDAGKARISRYSWRTKVQRLPIEAIAQSAARQRQGRAGRTAAGICVRLYSEEDFLNRPLFSDPEILRTQLAAVMLQMHDLGLGVIEEFPWLDAPEPRRINDGYRQLDVLEAIDRQRQITPLGQELARWPLDPQLARVLYSARTSGCLQETLAIVAALAVQDMRERPPEQAALADERHGRFSLAGSDPHFYVQLWQHLQQNWPDWSDRQRRAFSREHFLSWMRLSEWREMHRLLRLECEHRNWPINTTAATMEQVVAALLTGFPEQIARRDEQKEYRGTRAQKACLHPSSVLARKPPEWVLALEWVETSRLYMRQVVRIEPIWIERYLPYMLKRSFRDPHWECRQGRAMVMEQLHLMGLLVQPGRAVPLAAHDPAEARRLLIQEGLIGADTDLRAAFLQHNQQFLHQLHELEERARRRDLVVDAAAQYAFYDRNLPADIVDILGLQAWYRVASRADPALLFMNQALVQQQKADGVLEEFPAHLSTPECDYALSYVFAPGDPRDGVTLTCPVGRYHSLPWQDLEHLVPGLRPQKILGLLRSLAKDRRRWLMPIAPLAEQLNPPWNEPLLSGLCQAIARERSVQLQPEDFQESTLPQHLSVIIRVVDVQARVVAEGRNRRELDVAVYAWLKNHDTVLQAPLVVHAWTSWQDEVVAESVEYGSGLSGQRVYSALQDRNDRVVPVELPRPLEARQVHARGCARLYALQVADLLKPWQQKIRKSNWSQALVELGDLQTLADEWALAMVYYWTDLDQSLPYTRMEYERRLPLLRAQWASQQAPFWNHLELTAQYAQQVRKAIGHLAPVLVELRQDLEQQFSELLPKGWLWKVGYRNWQHYPRYLKAMLWRLERGGSTAQRDGPLMQDVQQRMQRCRVVLEEGERLQLDTSQVVQYRWMLEEYRVFLFAQHLKTAKPVSAVRLDRLWEQVGAAVKIR